MQPFRRRKSENKGKSSELSRQLMPKTKIKTVQNLAPEMFTTNKSNTINLQDAEMAWKVLHELLNQIESSLFVNKEICHLLTDNWKNPASTHSFSFLVCERTVGSRLLWNCS